MPRKKSKKNEPTEALGGGFTPAELPPTNDPVAARLLKTELVTVVNEVGKKFTVENNATLRSIAMAWQYRLARRQRWTEDSRQRALDDAYDDMRRLEINGDVAYEVLCNATAVEVQIPYKDEQSSWPFRIMPWEFLIAEAARRCGNPNELTIIRQLGDPRLLRGSYRPQEPRVLYVECATGIFNKLYSFKSERKIIDRNFPDMNAKLFNPTLKELEERLKSYKPNIVHFAGVDTHEALEVFRDSNDDQRPEEDHWFMNSRRKDVIDGIIFKRPGAIPVSQSDTSNVSQEWEQDMDYVPVGAEELIGVFKSSDIKLILMVTNIYHSAARTCSLAVAGKVANCAIGYQDTIDDTVAESSLGCFYRGWAKEDNPDEWPEAIVNCLDVGRSSGPMFGSGIVFWAAKSHIEHFSNESFRKRRKAQAEESATELTWEPDIKDWLEIQIKPHKRLNYSVLHNAQGGLYETFAIKKDKPGVLKNIQVHSQLYLGNESHPFNKLIDIEESVELAGTISVPLTSEVIRTVPEPINTSLYTRISIEDKVLVERTDPVSLLPPEEWRDTDRDRLWLPSFVLPRNSAVDSIINRAQQHLITLSDDQTSGFDSYQSINEFDPETWGEIDMQVQAIWAAIAIDIGLYYINPPPNYTESGQRLRTPIQTCREKHGTCIDLALLLAACLEYVEIHPVIFLLEGHAFAGYWRSEIGRQQFLDGFRQEAEFDIDDVDNKGRASDLWSVPRPPTVNAWTISSDQYPAVLEQLRNERIYPIETVGFSNHRSFWQAVDEGFENFRNRAEFHSLIDIQRAREALVTPLPIIEDDHFDMEVR